MVAAEEPGDLGASSGALSTRRKRSPPTRDRSGKLAIGRIEVNGNGGNGVSYVRLVENRWPSICFLSPRPPPVSIRLWPCFPRAARAVGVLGSEKGKKKFQRGEKKCEEKEKRKETVDDEQVGRDRTRDGTAQDAWQWWGDDWREKGERFGDATEWGMVGLHVVIGVGTREGVGQKEGEEESQRRYRGKETEQRKSIVRLLIEKWGRFMGYR